MSCKVILSRKGFDSSSGGIASPVINGQFFSLPIPEKDSGMFYEQLKVGKNGMDLLKLLCCLGNKKDTECHMDPNLTPSLYGLNESDGWCPAFGQEGIALTHLLKTNNVKPHDVFLFFGRFRNAEITGNEIKYKDKNEFHAIYGFMEIGNIMNVKCEVGEEQHEYRNHPHVKKSERYKPNSTLFIPAIESTHGFKRTFGTFKFDTNLVLSECGQSISNNSISHWQMQEPFWNKSFTYKLVIGEDGKGKSPSRGQEMAGDATPEIIDWIGKMIDKNINE